jgi:hypothetical protein
MHRTYVVYTKTSNRGPMRANSSWQRLVNAQKRARALEELGYIVQIVAYKRDEYLPVTLAVA